jgi:hypothetical protein
MIMGQIPNILRSKPPSSIHPKLKKKKLKMLENGLKYF